MGEEPESLLLLPGREPLVALGLLWGREATCHSGEGGAKIKDSGGCVCVEGIVGGHGTELGTRAFPPWPGDLKWGPGMELGRTCLCIALTRLLGTVPEPEGTHT